MKENEIRKLLRASLPDNSCVWFPARVMYNQNDIFGCYDCLVYMPAKYPSEKAKIYFIQITTLTNISHRVKKIQLVFANLKKPIPDNSFVYGWDKEKYKFKIVQVF